MYEIDSRLQVLSSQQLSSYDSSITTREVYLLQSIYVEAGRENRRQIRILRLLTNLAFVYDPSISHPSLRRAACAWISGWHFENHPDRDSYRWSAVQALRRRLNNPSVIDEGDLFAVLWLTLLSGVYARDIEFTTHIQGFLAVMKHLSQKARGDAHLYRLAILWPLLRDEIVLYGLDLFLGGRGTVMDTIIYEMCRPSYGLAGRKALRESQEYQSVIREVSTVYSVDGLVVTTWQQFVLLKKCIDMKRESRGRLDLESDAYVASILTDVQVNLSQVDDNSLIESLEHDMMAIWESEKPNPFYPLHIASGLLWLLLCRLLIIVIAAPSFSSGLNTTEAITVANQLATVIQRVENIAIHPNYPTILEQDAPPPRTRDGERVVENFIKESIDSMPHHVGS